MPAATTPPKPDAKSILMSKTFWVQVIALASLLVPAVREWVEANPVDFAAVWGACNILVRFFTSGRISLAGDQGGENSSGPTMALLVFMGSAAAVAGLLPSCAQMPLKATIFTDDGAVSYSSKGGLEVSYSPTVTDRRYMSNK
jgi:hypothetical protein